MGSWGSFSSFVIDRKERIVLASVILILIAINIPRLQFNLFWLDECFSILSIQSFDTLIDNALWDAGSHPPLYLFMLYIHCQIFGQSPVSYQLYPMIAWILMMIVGATFIRKRFGFASALIFILLTALLKSSIGFMTEVRSYEWDVLFILLCYIYLLKILDDHKIGDYCLFTAFSILSAYSHYYCALAVSFFYLTLIVDSLTRHKEEIKKVVMTCFVTIIAYAPWMIVALKSIVQVSNNFWAESVPSLLDCMAWMFDSVFNLGLVLFLITILFAICVIMKNMKKNGNRASNMDIWIIAGITSICGSVFISTIVSLIVSPILVARYLYPVSVVAWLLLSFTVVNYWEKDNRVKRKAIAAVIAFILILGTPFYCINYTEEIDKDDVTKKTLNDLNEIGKTDDQMILTNTLHFGDNIGEIGYYFLGVPSSDYDVSIIQQLKSDTQYYLLIKEKIDDETKTALGDNGYTYETMSENAQLDTCRFYAYKIIPL